MHPGGPVLHRHPDAREAPVPLPPAASWPYLALMVGIVPAAVGLLVTGLLLRRARPAVMALLVGLFGFLVPLFLIVAATGLGYGAEAIKWVLLVDHLVAVALGVWLYKIANPYLRGHTFLGGRVLPLMWLVVGTFALIMLLPGETLLLLREPIIPLFFQAGR